MSRVEGEEMFVSGARMKRDDFVDAMWVAFMELGRIVFAVIMLIAAYALSFVP